jgi:hypothetical protein
MEQLADKLATSSGKPMVQSKSLGKLWDKYIAPLLPPHNHAHLEAALQAALVDPDLAAKVTKALGAPSPELIVTVASIKAGALEGMPVEQVEALQACNNKRKGIFADGVVPLIASSLRSHASSAAVVGAQAAGAEAGGSGGGGAVDGGSNEEGGGSGSGGGGDEDGGGGDENGGGGDDLRREYFGGEGAQGNKRRRFLSFRLRS